MRWVTVRLIFLLAVSVCCLIALASAAYLMVSEPSVTVTVLGPPPFEWGPDW